MDQCSNCRFWRAVDERVGQCRYHAPVPAAPRGTMHWPDTLPKDWCGKHEAKGGKPATVPTDQSKHPSLRAERGA